MSCREIEFAKLDALEAQFRTRLMVALKDARDGKDSLVFLAPGFHAFTELQGREPARTVELADTAMRVLSLRQRLGLGTDCVAAAFLDQCRADNDPTAAHRLGAKRRAQAFLEKLTEA